MKIKQIPNIKYKLLKLKLIKSQFYKPKTKKINKYNKMLEQLEIGFKKNLQIIFEYHINNKQILFIGFPTIFKKNIFKKTQHLFISDSIWLNGILSNKISIFRYLNIKRLKQTKNKKFRFNNLSNLLELKNKPDLIVFFDQNKNIKILNDVYKTRIPIITFNNKILNNKLTYSVLKNKYVNQSSFKNVCFLCLYSIFKKCLSKKSKKINDFRKKTIKYKFTQKETLQTFV